MVTVKIIDTMKYPALLLFLTAFSGCGEDKHREDFPDSHNQGEIRSNERFMDENIRDTISVHDTTPGAVKFPE